MAKKIINSKYATKEDFIAFKNEIITACKSEKRILREEFSTWKKGFIAWKNRMPSGHDLAV